MKKLDTRNGKISRTQGILLAVAIVIMGITAGPEPSDLITGSITLALELLLQNQKNHGQQ